MAMPRFLAILLVVVAALLALSFWPGTVVVVVVEGRKVQVMRAVRHSGLRVVRLQGQQQGTMVSTMDYDEPKANTNPHGSVPTTPDYPVSPPGH